MHKIATHIRKARLVHLPLGQDKTSNIFFIVSITFANLSLQSNNLFLVPFTFFFLPQSGSLTGSCTEAELANDYCELRAGK